VQKVKIEGSESSERLPRYVDSLVKALRTFPVPKFPAHSSTKADAPEMNATNSASKNI
jgi:hypothetical protein